MLEQQRQSAQAIAPDERAVTVTYDADAPLEKSRHIEPWQPVLDRLRIEAATTR